MGVRDPFKITGPTCISFSGGRTSAYMLWRVLQSNGGLPADCHVVFANTGKEEEATLQFIRDCGEQWGVQIAWIEYLSKRQAPFYQVVDFEAASRRGEPFERCIAEHAVLPNPRARYCTAEMKIRTISRYLEAEIGWGPADCDMLLGIRADEQRRVAKLATAESRMHDRSAPLASAGVTAADVGAFWRGQSFDLGLPNMNGKTMHGNCDLCFLKPAAQVLSLIQEKPSRAVWWAAQENRQGITFRNDRPTYAQMQKFSADQTDMFNAEEAIPCFCGD